MSVGFDRGWLHTGQYPLPVILLYECRVTNPLVVLLGVISVDINRIRILGVRYLAHERHQWYGGLEVCWLRDAARVPLTP